MKKARTGMEEVIVVAPEVQTALAVGAPVVALESALITHGFAPPANGEIARQMEAIVREEGGVPATIAILDGRVHVGLTPDELKRLAADREAHKVSLRDLPLVVARRSTGGTTVAATIHLAHRAGIAVFATGGIGGVHRHHPEDVSADLPALERTPIVVVCAGAKAILDLPRTLEYLETHGVPVIGYGSELFPAFYSRQSGLRVDVRVDRPEEVADIAAARAAVGCSAALLICVPVPAEDELPAEEAEMAIARAVGLAEAQNVQGKALTPFLLSRLVALTGGQALRANQALLRNNARVATRIARVLST